MGVVAEAAALHHAGRRCEHAPETYRRSMARIGSALVRRMLAKLQHLYMIDLLSEVEIQPFYARLGMRPATGMLMRNYDRQACEPRAP